MDSLTQATLGAAVGVAVLGRTRPVWQAALAGAAVGTLPDLDVIIDHGDPIRNMVWHRAETHAFFWQALASPLIAALLAWITRSRECYWRWLTMVVLGLFTHAWLDAMTVYGTRLALPFNDHPFGVGSLFIIDPLYTLPLLLGLLMTAILRRPSRRRWNAAGLLVATLYAGWSVAAQAHITDKVMSMPIAEGLSREQILVTPTPFNTLLWRIILRTEETYAEGFYSVVDPWVEPTRTIRFDHHPRGAALDARTAQFADANLIRAFSKGFYALTDDGRQVRITDLRMGQHPYFAFSFAFAAHQSEPLLPIAPVRVSRRIPVDTGIEWLWRRMRGQDVDPPGASEAQPG